MNYCLSKKSHSFSIRFRVWIVTLHDPVILQMEQHCSKAGSVLKRPHSTLCRPLWLHGIDAVWGLAPLVT